MEVLEWAYISLKLIIQSSLEGDIKVKAVDNRSKIYIRNTKRKRVLRKFKKFYIALC